MHRLSLLSQDRFHVILDTGAWGDLPFCEFPARRTQWRTFDSPLTTIGEAHLSATEIKAFASRSHPLFQRQHLSADLVYLLLGRSRPFRKIL
jgi:hypothetical protein